MTNLNEFVNDNLSIFEHINFIQYKEMILNHKTKNGNVPIIVKQEKYQIDKPYKKGITFYTEFVFSFSIKDLDEMTKKFMELKKDLLLIDDWNSLETSYYEQYLKHMRKNFSLNDSDLIFEKYMLISMYIDFLVYNLSMMYNTKIDLSIHYYNETKINSSIYLFSNSINYNSISITPYYHSDFILIENNFPNKNMKCSVSLDEFKIFAMSLMDSFMPDIFLNKQSFIDEDKKENIYKILRDKKNPLNKYLTHIIEEDKMINEIKHEYNNSKLYKKRNTLKSFSFNNLFKNNYLIKEINQFEIADLIKHQTLNYHTNKLNDIFILIQMSLRLDDRLGCYFIHLFLYDLKEIIKSFSSYSVELDESTSIISNLFIKYESFYKLVQLLNSYDEKNNKNDVLSIEINIDEKKEQNLDELKRNLSI